MNKKGGIIAIIIFVVIAGVIILNYDEVSNFVGKIDQFTGKLISDQGEIANVSRVIDGDTLELVGGERVRMLGINTPEKKEMYYEEAKEYLANRVQGKEIRLIQGKEDTDLYDRKLRFVFIGDSNVNLEMIENGFANPYFPSTDKLYLSEFRDAWKTCVKENRRLCEISNNMCSTCIKLNYLDYDNEIALFENECELNCNMNKWYVKDEGRKKYMFNNIALDKKSSLILKVGQGKDKGNVLYWTGEDYVWTSTGDTLYLRDDQNKLILYHEY